MTLSIQQTWPACASACERVSVIREKTRGLGDTAANNGSCEVASDVSGYAIMYTGIFSVHRERVRQPSQPGCSSVKSLEVSVYSFSPFEPSHLRLLCSDRLGSSLRRLVALVEVSLSQLLRSFPPQNNLLNPDKAVKLEI